MGHWVLHPCVDHWMRAASVMTCRAGCFVHNVFYSLHHASHTGTRVLVRSRLFHARCVARCVALQHRAQHPEPNSSALHRRSGHRTRRRSVRRRHAQDRRASSRCVRSDASKRRRLLSVACDLYCAVCARSAASLCAPRFVVRIRDLVVGLRSVRRNA